MIFSNPPILPKETVSEILQITPEEVEQLITKGELAVFETEERQHGIHKKSVEQYIYRKYSMEKPEKKNRHESEVTVLLRVLNLLCNTEASGSRHIKDEIIKEIEEWQMGLSAQ